MYNIRLAVPEDFHSLLPMAQKFIASAKEFEGMDFDIPSILEHYISMLQYGFVLVAEDEGKAIGMLGCIVAPFHLNRNFIVCSESMWWVEPEYRGQSVASAMVEMAEKEAAEAGCHKVIMSALSSSPEIVHDYYKSRGYAPYETAYVRSL